MKLHETYKKVRDSIVAFVADPPAAPPQGQTSPQIPEILGTGFVVSSEGLIMTNDHVLKCFHTVPRPTGMDPSEWPITAMMLFISEKGVTQVSLPIRGVIEITGFNSHGSYYGPPRGPDLGIVQVMARGLTPVEIDAATQIEEGVELATAGFPMGTAALTAPGYLHQLTPTLQKGIVSAVLPFACETPHAFALNVMTQGGASGSPVFRGDTGRAVGILYAGLIDFDVTVNAKDPYAVPTNISHVVPAHYMKTFLEGILRDKVIRLPEEAQTLDEIKRSIVMPR